MDGVESRLSGSLRLRLSLWLALVIFAVALIAAAVSFVLSFNEAHELQDNMLRQTAALFDARHLPAPRPRGREPRSDVDPEARLRVALLGDSQGRRDRAGGLAFPPNLADGLQTRRLGDRSYRIFVRRLGPNERIAVA